MAYSAISVANSLLELAEAEGESLTNMKLQKLVYLVHGYGFALLGHGVFPDKVEAWQYGPVIPKLYDKLREFGRGPVTCKIFSTDDPIVEGTDEHEVVTGVWKAFSKFSAAKLVGITHKIGSPWQQVWTGNKEEIPVSIIQEYYQNSLDGSPA